MSSLAEQLKKLAVPQIRHSLEGRKSSLLYDAEEVASLDKEVILELAVSGLNSLITVNKSFAKYETILFSKSQLGFNRMVQTKEVNQNLNKIIKQFLIEVSPYFLMKSAQKTLEWLVYRYQIHLFNVDDLLLTLFPYHYSNMFVKVLTILDIENPNNKWHWLNNCAKSGTPLPKSVIINHCKKDSLFLHAVFSLVDEYVKLFGRNNSHLNLIFEHTNSIALSLLADASEISEEIASALVQFSIRGLKSKCSVWELCCYTIISSLAAKVTLNFDNVLLFCQLISKKHSDDLFKEAICCLSVLVANQSAGKYPDDVFKSLKLNEIKLMELQNIMETFDISPLLTLLMNTCDKIVKVTSKESKEPILADLHTIDYELPAIKEKNVIKKNKFKVEKSVPIKKSKPFSSRHLALKHQQISEMLNEVTEPQVNQPKMKKIKVDKAPLDLEKIKNVLEMVLSGKELDSSKEMGSLMSSILSKLLLESGGKVEYCTQLTLTILCQIIQSWKAESLKSFENSINVEVLVQCLRRTRNVQTQQHVLLVLAALSNIFPDQLLHNIVSIFTFMGDNFLQKDDAYTFQVMTKLIDVALSAVKQLPEGSGKVEEILLNVYRVFVDARQHIPQHRLIPLFKQLVDFDRNEYLWKLVVLIVESSVRQRDSAKSIGSQKSGTEDPKQIPNVELDVVLVLISEFDVKTRLKAINSLIKFVDESLPVLKKSTHSIPIVNPGIQKFPHLCRLLIFHLNKIILSIISDKVFISDFLESMNNDEDDDSKSKKRIENIFSKSVNGFVVHMLHVSDQQKTNTSDSIYEKYYPSLLKIIHNTLDKLNYLMPAYLFVDVIESLLNHEQAPIQCKALELMNSKLLQVDHNHTMSKSLECSLKLIPKLLTLVQEDQSRSDQQTNLNYNRQLCFINMKMLCRYYGADNQQVFDTLHEEIRKVLIKSSDTNLAVLDSSLLCLADLISVRRNNFFPHLKPLMIPFMKLLDDDRILKSPVSINCLLMVVSKCILHLGQFLSPFINNLVQMLGVIFIQADTKQQCTERLLNVLQAIAKNIDCRIVLPCLLKAFDELVNKNQRGLFILFTLFHHLMQNATKESINANMKSIIEIVCLFLNVRVSATKLKVDELVEIENLYVDSILLFVVHLSEVTFRPMFQKLFNSLEDNLDRCLTFYHLVFRLAQKLKSIFNIFASCLIKQMSDLLDRHNMAKSTDDDNDSDDDDNTNEVKSKSLINYLLDTIGECYLHDIDGSFSSGTGDALFKPVVNQLENISDDNNNDDNLYINMVAQHLTPCIVQMTQSIKNNDHLFALHRMICHQTKHNSSKVRVSAIRVIRVISDGLGSSYEVLFPETAPYLAELLEDDSEEVVKECQELRKHIERITNLDDLF